MRDASGNVMSVYELPAAEQLVQKELHLYGSSRIGIVKVDNEVVERIPLSGGGEMVIRKQVRGNKFFETTNHLGNVLATVTDRKLLQSSTEQAGINNGGCQPGTAVEELTVMQRGTASQFTARTAVYLEAGFETVDAVDELEVNTSTQQGSCVVLPPATISNGQAWYVADVVSATDYAPGGMQLPGRTYNTGSYAYGFNGKRMDNDISGIGAQYDYGFRIYDPRLVRFKSVDPLTSSYPELTPYQFAGNSPITFIDLDGLEMAWRNPATGEVKAAGPLTLPVGTRNSDGWILFEPPVKRSGGSTPAPDIPGFRPALQQGSDNLASVKAAQNKQLALKTTVVKPKVAHRVTTVSADKRSFYEKQKSEEYAAGIERNKALQNATMDQFAAQQILMTANTGAEYVKGVAEHAEGVYNGINDGNYWSAAGNGLLLGLEIAPWTKLAGSSTAKEGIQSLGAGRATVKQWLQGAGNLERSTLIQNIESAGFKRMSPTTSPVNVFERGGMRIRLDPPQPGTPFNHMHLEYGGNSYNIFLNPVKYKSPAAHIPIR